MAAPNVYDPKQVTLTIGGQTVTGFAEGSKVTITKTDGLTSTTRGMDGDISIDIINMVDGTATFTLLHNTSFNDTMRDWAYSYRSKTTRIPYVPFEMNDPSGGKISTVAWLETQPDYDVGQATGEQAWTVHLQDAVVKNTRGLSRLDAASKLSGFSGLI
jgi:hypothetical protein